MKIAMLSTIAAAILAVSATAAFADGMDADFYAIQRGLPYAGASAPLAPPDQGLTGNRVFLNGYESGPVVHHHNRRVIRRIERQ